MLTAKRVKFSLPFFEKDNKHEYFFYISARLTIQQGLEEVLQAMLLFAKIDKVGCSGEGSFVAQTQCTDTHRQHNSLMKRALGHENTIYGN